MKRHKKKSRTGTRRQNIKQRDNTIPRCLNCKAALNNSNCSSSGRIGDAERGLCRCDDCLNETLMPKQKQGLKVRRVDGKFLYITPDFILGVNPIRAGEKKAYQSGAFLGNQFYPLPKVEYQKAAGFFNRLWGAQS